MNLPYDNAKDAVEFWRECLLVLDDSPGDIPELTIEAHFTSDEDMEAFTRDMLARCVLWLSERGWGVWPHRNESGVIVFRFGPTMPEAPVVSRVSGPCIFTAHKQAVLAVSGEGGE